MYKLEEYWPMAGKWKEHHHIKEEEKLTAMRKKGKKLLNRMKKENIKLSGNNKKGGYGTYAIPLLRITKNNKTVEWINKPGK